MCDGMTSEENGKNVENGKEGRKEGGKGGRDRGKIDGI